MFTPRASHFMCGFGWSLEAALRNCSKSPSLKLLGSQGHNLRYGASLLSVGFSILLLGCSSTTAVSPESSGGQTNTSPSSTQAEPLQANRGQSLPVSAQAEVRAQTIQLEVAQTRSQQAMGLMYRTSLADDRGMLFPFDPPQTVSFWMQNVVIPLDMVFLQDGVVRAIAADVPLCSTEPCPTYGPGVPVDQVIELRGGRAAELGIQVGDRINIEFL